MPKVSFPAPASGNVRFAGGRGAANSEAARIESLEAEVAALQEALVILDGVVTGLRDTLLGVATMTKKVGEPSLMPNYARAEEQLRVALNATTGATKSLHRRLDMRSQVLARARGRRGGG